MNEEWRDVLGYEGLYQVSSLGRVKSLRREIILKQSQHHHGYLVVQLNKDGKGKMKGVANLVADAFPEICGEHFPGAQVNHLDENKQNNTVWNLFYVTPGENTNWGTRNKRVSEKMTNGKLSKPLIQRDLDGNFIKEWPSAMEVQRVLGFTQAGISACCNGQYQTMNGYRWSYK